MPNLTLTLSDGTNEWTVRTPITTITPYVIDWLIERLQQQLSEDEKGKVYLAQ